MNPTECSQQINLIIEKVRKLPEDEQRYFYLGRSKRPTTQELAATFKADILQANEEQSTHLPVDVGDEVAQYLESLVEGLDAILNQPSEVHAILAAVDRLPPTMLLLCGESPREVWDWIEGELYTDPMGPMLTEHVNQACMDIVLEEAGADIPYPPTMSSAAFDDKTRDVYYRDGSPAHSRVLEKVFSGRMALYLDENQAADLATFLNYLPEAVAAAKSYRLAREQAPTPTTKDTQNDWPGTMAAYRFNYGSQEVHEYSPAAEAYVYIGGFINFGINLSDTEETATRKVEEGITHND